MVRWLGWERGPCFSERADPHPQVKAFSYQLVMPCHHYCSRLVRECISFRLWYSASCKSPQRDSRHALGFSLRKAFLAGRCQKRNDLGFWGRGAIERGWKNKNVLCRNPLEFFFFLLHTNTIPSASVTARFFSVPDPFFFFFFLASLSLTVPENPTFSSVGDQSSKLSPSRRMRSRIPGLWADPWGHCLRLWAGKKKCCFCCCFVQEQEHLLHFAISPPNSCSLAPLPSGFNINHESGGHTWWFGLKAETCSWERMAWSLQDWGGWEDRNCIYLDSFGTKGRPTMVGCKRREIEKKKKSQWNILVRGDLMGGMMDTEGLLWSTREKMTPLLLFHDLCSVGSRWHLSKGGQLELGF